MNDPKRACTDQSRLDALESLYEGAIRSLRIGFLLATVLMVAGLVWSLAEQEALSENVVAIEDLPRSLRNGEPSALIDLAILAIMLTPVVTTLIVAVGFLRTGDRRYAALSLLVLAILLMSIGTSLVG
jgi:uncharacterized membrane protein